MKNKYLVIQTHDLLLLNASTATAGAAIATGDITNILLAIAQILTVVVSFYKIYKTSKTDKNGSPTDDLPR